MGFILAVVRKDETGKVEEIRSDAPGFSNDLYDFIIWCQERGIKEEDIYLVSGDVDENRHTREYALSTCPLCNGGAGYEDASCPTAGVSLKKIVCKYCRTETYPRKSTLELAHFWNNRPKIKINTIK